MGEMGVTAAAGSFSCWRRVQSSPSICSLRIRIRSHGPGRSNCKAPGLLLPSSPRPARRNVAGPRSFFYKAYHCSIFEVQRRFVFLASSTSEAARVNPRAKDDTLCTPRLGRLHACCGPALFESCLDRTTAPDSYRPHHAPRACAAGPASAGIGKMYHGWERRPGARHRRFGFGRSYGPGDSGRRNASDGLGTPSHYSRSQRTVHGPFSATDGSCL